MYVLTQFNSASLNRHIAQTYNLSGPFGQGFVEVLAAQQTPETPSWFEGTADAVRKYQWLFQEWDVDEYLILSGDQLYRMDYSLFVEQHRKTGADLTVAALPVDSSQAEAFGLMRTDESGNIKEFREKPTGDSLKAMAVDTSRFGLEAIEAKEKPYLASMGIYVFSRSTLFDLLNKFPSYTDFGKEIIPEALGRGDKLKSYVFNDYWEDIGTIRAFFEANLDMVSTVPKFDFFQMEAPIFTRPRFMPASKINGAAIDQAIISDGCIIDRSRISQRLIGVRCLMAPGCRVHRSVLMGADFYETEASKRESDEKGIPRVGVGENTRIESAIIDKNARIGANCVISPEGKPEHFDGENYFIREGIAIVPKGAVIADGMVI